MRRILLMIAALLLLPTPASAQIRIQITGGAEAALPIAIVPFRVEDGASPPGPDVAGIVRNDLQRTGMFDPLAEDNFISRPSRFEDVRFQNWRALGADNLVVGSIRAAGDGSWEVRFELLDVYQGNRLVGKRYRVASSGLRTLAHTISNEIFKALIGRPGGFNTRIAYVQVETDGKKTIHKLVVSEADGHSPQVILTSREPIMSPAWSPDRKKLAYVSFEGRSSEIFVQEVATGKRRKVASYKGINGAPAWAPDGRRLALTLSKDGNPDIFVLDLDSGRLNQVTNHWAIDTEPVWGPNGKQIYFTSDRGGKPQIYRKSVAGGSAERITFEGDYNANPALSPDGKLLAMVHRDKGGFQIAIMDLEKGLMRVLTKGP
ncbi:MAG: Tol-Pal system beta propeller repeat protein TolB, partial [Ectothiorhodospiraceae bacterium]